MLGFSTHKLFPVVTLPLTISEINLLCNQWSGVLLAHLPPWCCIKASQVCSGKESTFRCRRCETEVQSLGAADPLGEERKTPSSILAWKILWTEEPGGLQSVGSQRVGHDWARRLHKGMVHLTVNSDSGCDQMVIHFGLSLGFSTLQSVKCRKLKLSNQLFSVLLLLQIMLSCPGVRVNASEA